MKDPVSKVEFVEARVSFSKDQKYLLHKIDDRIIIRKHVNFYKKLFGIPFVSESKAVLAPSISSESSMPDFESFKG